MSRSASLTADKRGFTLVELLVVVTIIVILLALLVPSMDKAIYQAELVSCAARLKAVGAAVTTYAFENRRYYPHRDLPPTRTGVGNPEYVAPMELVRPVNTFDMRPAIRGVLNINKILQCPFTDDTLEMDSTPADEQVFASYAMWWGWRYIVPSRTSANAEQGSVNTSQAWSGAGMYKLGDRFTWLDDSYDVLVGDYDLYNASGGVLGSHPDDQGVTALVTYRRVTQFGVPVTVSVWLGTRPDRGLVDLNHAFTDGSVRHSTAVKPYLGPDPEDRDSRMGAVPSTWTNREPAKAHQLPR